MKMVNKLVVVFFVIALALAQHGTASALNYLSTHDDTNLWLKEGSANAPWDVLLGNVSISQAQTSGNRTGFLDSSGRVWVKDGSKTAPWILLADNVYEFKMLNDQIYIIDSSFQLRMKAGDIKNGWILLKTNTYQVEVSPSRILATTNYDGYQTELVVKEGSIYSPWVTLAYPVSYYDGSASLPMMAVSDKRIAYFEGDYDNFRYKEGSIYGSWWTWIYGGAGFGVELTNDRMCINTAENVYVRVYCRDGLIYQGTSWVMVHGNAYLTDISENTIAIHSLGGDGYPIDSLEVLSGSLAQNTGWKNIDVGQWLDLSK